MTSRQGVKQEGTANGVATGNETEMIDMTDLTDSDESVHEAAVPSPAVLQNHRTSSKSVTSAQSGSPGTERNGKLRGKRKADNKEHPDNEGSVQGDAKEEKKDDNTVDADFTEKKDEKDEGKDDKKDSK